MNGTKKLPKIIEKPWGKEVLITVNDKYAFKEILMNKGTRSSLQSHDFKLETIFIVSGKIELEKRTVFGEKTFKIYCSEESYTIKPKEIHRVTVLEDSRLLEVSTPELDDVIRHEDDHGRVK